MYYFTKTKRNQINKFQCFEIRVQNTPSEQFSRNILHLRRIDYQH